MNASFILQLVTAITALVAVLIGPFQAWKIARRQIHAQLISASRQKWIDTLRIDIAQLISQSRALRRAGTDGQQQQAILKDLSFLTAKIRLSLNPNEAGHNQLMSLIQELVDEIADIKRADDDVGEGWVKTQVEKIASSTQAILKGEWDRVKRGD